MDILEFCNQNITQSFITPTNTQIINYLKTYKGILDIEIIKELNIQNYKNYYVYKDELTLYQRIYKNSEAVRDSTSLYIYQELNN